MIYQFYCSLNALHNIAGLDKYVQHNKSHPLRWGIQNTSISSPSFTKLRLKAKTDRAVDQVDIGYLGLPTCHAGFAWATLGRMQLAWAWANPFHRICCSFYQYLLIFSIFNSSPTGSPTLITYWQSGRMNFMRNCLILWQSRIWIHI